jgi:hypothetical protein
VTDKLDKLRAFAASNPWLGDGQPTPLRVIDVDQRWRVALSLNR